MKNRILITTIMTLAGTVVQAQELTYGQFYAGNVKLSADGAGDTNAQILGGGLEFAVDAFMFSLDGARVSTDLGDLTVASVAADYSFGSGFTLGLEHVALDFEGIDTSINSVYGYYDAGPYAFGVSVGDSSDLDENVYGAFASFDRSENGTIGVDYLRFDDADAFGVYADYDFESYDIYAAYVNLDAGSGFGSIDGFVVDGSFYIARRISITGGYATFSSGGTDVDTYSIGGKYDVADNVAIGASFGRISADGAAEDVDVLSFAVEFETGKRQSARRGLTDLFGRVGNGTFGSFGY